MPQRLTIEVELKLGPNMNSYADSLATARDEIRAFALTEEGRKWDSAWYDQIFSLVEKAHSQTRDEGAERYLDMLLHAIVDSGPLGKAFAPSIDQAAEAMQRKRKRVFQDRRSHE